MADHFIGLNRGQGGNPGNITAGNATGSTDMELRYDTGKGTTKKDLLLFIEVLEQYIAGDGLSGGATGTFLPPL
jgi:hypothetical protein